MSKIFAEGNMYDELVGLGVMAGVFTKDDSKANMQKFKVQLKSIIAKYKCDSGRYDKLAQPEHDILDKVLDVDDFYPEDARFAARQAANLCMVNTPRKVWCICPEMKTDNYTAFSAGNETTGSWKYRDTDRETGKDIPFGGCVCYIQTEDKEWDIWMIAEQMQMAPSS